MSGVIDEHGNQWEHCHCCGKFVLIQELEYEKPHKDSRYGRDLCHDCAKNHAHGEVESKPKTFTVKL